MMVTWLLTLKRKSDTRKSGSAYTLQGTREEVSLQIKGPLMTDNKWVYFVDIDSKEHFIPTEDILDIILEEKSA